MTDAFTDRLSEYLDDELSTEDRARVAGHLRECAACRTTLDELRRVVANAGALTPSAPDRDLWSGIASRIGGDERRAFVRAFRRVISSRLSFTLPQLAAAALALMVLSGGLVWMARSGDPRADFPSISAADFADRRYDDAVADLRRRFDAGRTNLDPDTARIIDENLNAIDRAADECRSALEGDPANVYLNTHLADTRQRKLALLRSAAALVRNEER